MVFDKITQDVLKRVEKPTFDYLNKRDFNELYESCKTFWQVGFYDKTVNSANTVQTILFIDNEKDFKKVVAEIQEYNRRLAELQDVVIKNYVNEKKLSMLDKDSYLSSNKIDESFGLCCLRTFIRSRLKEL